jgi:uncharacterized protein YcbX
MRELLLSGLYIYPVKSLAGIPLQQSVVDYCGLQHDRRWLIVDQEGEFLSQRRLPRMALIRQRIADKELILEASGSADLHLPLNQDTGDWLKVTIWGEKCLALHCGDVADAWLSKFLGQSCRLAFMPETHTRRVTPDYAGEADQTAFSDGYPLLLISESSLEELNHRLEEPVPMIRFRPNLVVKGCGPFAEDTWSRLRIGDLTMRVAKPCSRCIITTIDPLTAERGSEPLQTLSQFRRRGNKVYFGQNLLHDGTGQLAVGMSVEILPADYS